MKIASEGIHWHFHLFIFHSFEPYISLREGLMFLWAEPLWEKQKSCNPLKFESPFHTKGPFAVSSSNFYSGHVEVGQQFFRDVHGDYRKRQDGGHDGSCYFYVWHMIHIKKQQVELWLCHYGHHLGIFDTAQQFLNPKIRVLFLLPHKTQTGMIQEL